MKKLFLASFMLVFVLAFNANAGNAVVFDIDDAKIASEFAELEQLENYVLSTGKTYSEISNSDNSMVAGLNLNSDLSVTMFNMANGEPPLGIPSFVWGFCTGWVGILIVYLVADDRDETIKAVKGCVVSSLLGILIYVVVVVLIIGTAASTTAAVASSTY